MTSMRTILIVSSGVLFGCIAAGDSARAGSEWSVQDQVAEVELSRSGQLLRVRYEGEDQFSPVEEGVVKSLVEGLSFHGRELAIGVRLVERAGDASPDASEPVKNALDAIPEGTILVCLWHPIVCRTVCEESAQIVGSVFVELPLRGDDRWRVKYPDGQVVTISQGGAEVDFGQGPPLLTFFGPGFYGETHGGQHEEMSGVNFLGARGFTLFEFFEPVSKRVISRNVVTGVLFE